MTAPNPKDVRYDQVWALTRRLGIMNEDAIRDRLNKLSSDALAEMVKVFDIRPPTGV